MSLVRFTFLLARLVLLVGAGATVVALAWAYS